MFTVEGSYIRLRPIAESDADLVVKWRNSKEAREAFFSSHVVTPDTHIAFVRNRKPHDLVWIVETVPSVFTSTVGVVSLTVDVNTRRAEFGRLFVDEVYRGSIYTEKIVYTALYYGFEVLGLTDIWADVKTSNDHALDLYKKVGFAETAMPSMHADAVILFYPAGYWLLKGRKQFESLIETELPLWE